MKPQKRNTQNSNFKEENRSRFYSWGLQWTVVKKVCSIAFFLIFSFFCRFFFCLLSLRALQLAYVERFTLLFLAMTAASLSLACWYFHISRIADRLGMTWVGASWTSVEPAWKPVLNCQNLATWFPYIAIWWINSKVPEGSITSENSSVARESSCVIILKSRLDSTGHSASTSEVRDIFDRQTHVPNDWWQLMCSHVLQPWDRCNSMTAPVRNITVFWKEVSLFICIVN